MALKHSRHVAGLVELLGHVRPVVCKAAAACLPAWHPPISPPAIMQALAQLNWHFTIDVAGEGGDGSSGSSTMPASGTTPSAAAASNVTAGSFNTTQQQGSTQAAAHQFITIDFPLDGRGAVEVEAGAVLSPVLTLWVTLMVLYIGACAEDHLFLLGNGFDLSALLCC